MNKEDKIQLFQEQKVRTHWDEERGKWFFSIVDMIAILSQSIGPPEHRFLGLA